ncbi:MAG TPA: YfhO family protein, partial [Anaerolineae bacterium]
FYPGWVARVDGREEPIRRADVMLRAVRVGAGAHRIEFAYEPRSFETGLWVSALTGLLGAGALGFSQMRRRVN